MKKTVLFIENISEWTGKTTAWLCLAVALLLTFESFMRYVLNNPTIYSAEIAMSTGVAIYVLGLAYTQLHRQHVRVDVVWRLLPPRGKTLIDIIVSILFLFPLLIALVYVSTTELLFSWSIKEILADTYLYPPAWPIRLIIVIGLFLFIPQGIADLIRDLHFVIRKEAL
jgi:TRAP-type mannitol/chloroaromatic compound transport system permease small subunit